MELDKEHTIILDAKYESYSATKNSKGWNYEVKIIAKPELTDEQNVARLGKITDMLEKKYGSAINI